MKIQHALQEYLLEIEVRKYTQKTIRSYRNNLNLFVRYLDEEADVFDTEDLTLAAVRKFSAYMVGHGKKRSSLFVLGKQCMGAFKLDLLLRQLTSRKRIQAVNTLTVYFIESFPQTKGLPSAVYRRQALLAILNKQMSATHYTR